MKLHEIKRLFEAIEELAKIKDSRYDSQDSLIDLGNDNIYVRYLIEGDDYPINIKISHLELSIYLESKTCQCYNGYILENGIISSCNKC